MKDSCSQTLARGSSGMAGRSLVSTPPCGTSLHVRVLRSNSKLPKTSFTDLPDELLLYLLKFLPLCDLENIYRINKQFKWLLDSSPRIWAQASLVGRWPCNSKELRCFKRLAKLGSLEAMIKLGVAFLYSEGVESNLCKDGSQAAKYFASAERYAPGSNPFTWLFIRPPWSNSGTCCKARVFQCMKGLSTQMKDCDRSLLFCLAKLHSFLEEMEFSDRTRVDHQSESRRWLRRAAEEGNVAARYELWKNTLTDSTMDTATNLNILRQLREFASQGSLEAKLRLYSEYAKGKLGGITKVQALETIRTFVKSSQPTSPNSLPRMPNGLTSSMRYILVDWLVEVASMKDYSCLTIHTAVQLVDRYLTARKVDRATLQLVGITCMVICSRLLEDDIITIREAAWLTDGTYKYEDVVRMLGDVVATLKGNLRELTILDYLHLFCQMVAADRKMEYLALYISELSLLHTDFGQYSRAHIAACSLFLARLITGEDFPWPPSMVEYTGLEVKDLKHCTLHLHNKCFFEEAVRDHREVTLAAVKQRFSEELFLGVSKMEAMDHTALRTMLCMEEDDEGEEEEEEGICKVDATPSNKDGLDAFLLMSPSRKSRGKGHQRRPNAEFIHDDHRRDRVSTPTHEFPEGEELAYGIDIKPIDADVSDLDLTLKASEKDLLEVKLQDSIDNHTASWSVLDESPSVNFTQTKSASMSSSSSRASFPSSSSTKASSSPSLVLTDIPGTSNSISCSPLSSTSTSLASSTSTSMSASSSRSRNQVMYTISSSGRLCQQKVRSRKMVGSPRENISKGRILGNSSSSSSSNNIEVNKIEEKLPMLSPAAVRYQFRQRTPVQTFKRKNMEDSSDESH